MGVCGSQIHDEAFTKAIKDANFARKKDPKYMEHLLKKFKIASDDSQVTVMNLDHIAHLCRSEKSAEGGSYCSVGDILCEFLPENKSIKELRFNSMNLKNEGFMQVAKAVEKSTTITSLCFVCDSIEKEGLEAICNAIIKTSAPIQKLQFCDIPIGDDGTESIAKVISQKASLTSLDISSCMIGSVGAEKLYDAITTTKKLQELDISVQGDDVENAITGELVQKFEEIVPNVYG